MNPDHCEQQNPQLKCPDNSTNPHIQQKSQLKNPNNPTEGQKSQLKSQNDPRDALLMLARCAEKLPSKTKPEQLYDDYKNKKNCFKNQRRRMLLIG